MNMPRENETSAETLTRQVLPSSVLHGERLAGEALDPQVTVNTRVSSATLNARQWDRKTLDRAFRAARPVAENTLRLQGRVFSRNDVRILTRSYLSSYVRQYGVILPPGTTLGGSALESVAADVCGALDAPLMMLMPPQVQLASKLASAGNKKAKGWLSRFFGRSKPTAPAPAPIVVPVVIPGAAPATPPSEAAVAAPPAALPDTNVVVEKAVDTAGSGDSLGAWLHALNPFYWLKSKEERGLIDKERQAWIENAELQKKLAKRTETLTQATKAQEAQAAVQAAKARSAELEAQLKSIETQLSGSMMGRSEILGAEKAPEDLESPVDAEDAEPVLKRVQKARALNASNSKDLGAIGKKISAGGPLTPKDTAQVMQYLARNERLHDFRKSLVSGENYKANPSKNAIQRQVVLGAMKAMTPTEQQMVAKMVAMAKAGNPNAQLALAKLQKQGYATTLGSDMGWGITDAFKFAFKPITEPAKYLWKGTKWVGRKMGIGKGGGASPEQIRLQRLQASKKRMEASAARARAADAETAAEQRVQEQLAAAADAEADAADAEANAREARMLSAEAQFAPATTPAAADDAADQSGHDEAGKVEITKLPPTPTTADKLKAARRAVIAKKNPRAAAILAASEQDTPAGKKLRASMELYAKAKRGGRREKVAVAVMAKKARRGDKQAQADIRALKAAQLAYKAERSAGRRVAIAAAKRSANLKGIAVQKRFEVAMSEKLIRHTRKKQLAKVARIERKAAAGDKKSQAVIKRVVAKAKAGDKNALVAARAFKLAQVARKTTPTRAERKKMRAAHKIAIRVRKGNRKALAQVRVINAAAKAGNINAKKAQKRLQVAAATELALTTGAITLPAAMALSVDAKKKHAKKQRQCNLHIASVKSKVAKGTASREEAQAAASEAASLGDTETARQLAAKAVELPSAQDNLRRVATGAAAAAAGNPDWQAKVAKAQAAAETGDPSGVAAMGQLTAVKALDQVRQGKGLDPEMKTAVADLEHAQQGNEEAKEKIALMQKQSATGDASAVKYMVYATGATVVARSLANNPAAKEEWLQKAGVAPQDTTNEEVVTERGAVLPPMATTLPDLPLAPIRGVLGLLKESVKALVLATRDPFANHREGLDSLSRKRAVDGAAGEEKCECPVAKKPVKKTAKKPPDEEYEVHGGQTLPAKKSPFSEPDTSKPSPFASAQDKTLPAKKSPFTEPDTRKPSPFASSQGDDPHAKIIEATKARLTPVKAAADKGDKEATRKWLTAVANYRSMKKSSDKGDAKAKDVVAILEATGLFKGQ
jgi:hypothetical protein